MDQAIAARIEQNLTPEQRAIARALRRAATVTAAACLPAEYRAAGFKAAAAVELERELRTLDLEPAQR